MDLIGVIYVLVVVVGVALAILVTVLVRKWNRENRERYPDRVSNKFFEINRQPRR